MKVYGNKPPEKQEALAKVQGAGHPDLAQEKGSVEKINPIDRADLSGKAKGISEMLMAADMPIIPRISAIFSSPKESTDTMPWVSE